MFDVLVSHPIISGIIVFLLINLSAIMGFFVKKESYRAKKYQIVLYPDSFEQLSQNTERVFDIKTLIWSIIYGLVIICELSLKRDFFQEIVLGFFIGYSSLIIIDNLRDLLILYNYRKGFHGKTYIHNRTSLHSQIVEWFKDLLIIIFITTMRPSYFLVGILLSSLTILIMLKNKVGKAPKIPGNDEKPDDE